MQHARIHQVFLGGVNTGNLPFAGEACQAGVKRDKMRRQQDRRAALLALKVFAPAHSHQAQDALARRPPQDAALEYAAREHAKMPLRQHDTRLFGHFRKTARQVNEADAAPLTRQRIKQHAKSPADARQQRQGQEVQQPDQRNDRIRRHQRTASGASQETVTEWCMARVLIMSVRPAPVSRRAASPRPGSCSGCSPSNIAPDKGAPSLQSHD